MERATVGGVSVSYLMMCALGVAYVVIMFACFYEAWKHNDPRKLMDGVYWLGAGIITLSLILRRG